MVTLANIVVHGDIYHLLYCIFLPNGSNNDSSSNGGGIDASTFNGGGIDSFGFITSEPIL